MYDIRYYLYNNNYYYLWIYDIQEIILLLFTLVSPSSNICSIYLWSRYVYEINNGKFTDVFDTKTLWSNEEDDDNVDEITGLKDYGKLKLKQFLVNY